MKALRSDCRQRAGRPGSNKYRKYCLLERRFNVLIINDNWPERRGNSADDWLPNGSAST